MSQERRLGHIVRTMIWRGMCIASFGTAINVYGQVDPCGAEAYNAQLMQSPDYATMIQQLESAYQAGLGQNDPSANGGTGNYVIPCVVHILYDDLILDSNDETTDAENTPDQAVIDAICLTNKYLAGQDGSGVQVGPDTKIELRLATIDPSGNATTGILHHAVPKSCAYVQSDPPGTDGCYTSGALQTQFGWDQSSYLNIFSVDVSWAGLGFAATWVNIILDNAQLNIPASLSPLTESKTLVHESGHYFNLVHVNHGDCHDPVDCAIAGDYVCDTEQASFASGNYPPGGNTYVDVASDCPLEVGPWPKYDLMSYSHYTSHRFTLGQIDRMQSALLTPQGETHWSASNLAATGTADPYSTACCTLEMTLTVVQPACENSGSITVNITGANGATTIKWFNDTHLISGQSGATLSGLSPGYYDVQVSDAGGCFVWSHVELTLGQPISVNGTAYPSCVSTPNGLIDLQVAGGAPPLSFLWTGPGEYSSTMEDISSISGGVYAVTVTDAGGCQVTASFTVGLQPAISLSALVGATCSSASTGSIDLSISGGTSPFTFQWTGPGGFSSAQEDLSSLAGGTYSVTVTDASGCQEFAAFSVGTQPVMSLTTAIIPDCNTTSTGSIDLSVSGGTSPFTFQWIGPGGLTYVQEDLNTLTSGGYSVTVTDAAGCSASLTVPVANSIVQISAQVTDVACSTTDLGAIDITPSGGVGPYSFTWSNGEFTEDVVGLQVGAYMVTVHDVNGCSTQQTFNVIDASPCCAADRFYPHGTLSSTVSNPASGTIDIQGQFIIDQDFTFDNATVYMEPGAEILQLSGVNLWLNNSTFESCQGVMWKGVTTGNGCILQLKGTTIADAESGIRAMNSSIVLVDNSEFSNNRVGIEVPDQGGFNSVAIYAENSTFHAEGPLVQPYAGQTTVLGGKGYAALDVWDMSLDFSGVNNIIHDLSNGILADRSDVNVQNCFMHDIQPDAAYASPSNGSGIYARGGEKFVSLKQQGFGTASGVAPSFENCYWGIYTEYMDVYSSLNFMNNVGTAYRVDRSGYRHVDIQNNLLDTRRDGIVLNMNDGAAYVLVQNNDITFARNLPLGQYTKGYYAIRVNEANTLNPSSQILNNIIHYRQGASTAYGGIGLISARKYLVAGNQLHMTDNASNRLGIYLGGCEEADLSCNQILGANNGYPDLSQSGIRNFMGHAPEISCNTVDRTTNGMLFSGWALDTDLKGNEFNNHKYGLHLEQDALIGEQELRGNLWLATAQVWGAWYESPANALLNRIKYDQGQPNNIPSSYAPSSWFQPFSGTTFQCATEDYCAVIHERCTDCPKEIYERIADETLENGEYTDETRWTLKGDLYATLKKAPELMNDPDMAAFYDVVQNTVAGQLKDLDDERLSLFDLDPTVLAQLQLNRQQLLVLQAQVKIALEQLTAPDLTEAQKIALEGSISGLQQDMAGLTAYNKTALDLAVNSRVLSAESVKTTNTGIAASELTETNYKTVNKIYLGTVAKDIDEFTGAEAQDLFAVANQCPLVGGNAVFQARALYYLIDPEQDFDDPSLCLQHGLITKSQKIRAEVAASMIPNPAVDAATLVLPAPLEEAGQLVLYDAVGAEVLRIPIPADQQRTLVNTARLATGVYHYRVLSDQGEPGNGKLSIAR